MRTDSPMELLNLPHMASKSMLRKALLFPYQIFIILLFFLLTSVGGGVSYVASFFDANGNLAHRCITQWARTSLALAGLRVHIEGQERLNPQNTYIFMPNHASFLDTLLAFAYIPCDFRDIIKEEVFSIPLLGLVLRRSGQIPLDRKNPWKALKSLRQAADLLNFIFQAVIRVQDVQRRAMLPCPVDAVVHRNDVVPPAVHDDRGTGDVLRRVRLETRHVERGGQKK